MGERAMLERSRKMKRMSSLRIARKARMAVGVCAVGLASLGIAAPANADFGVVPGSFSAELLDAGALPQTQAGSHPDKLVTKFDLITKSIPDPNNPGSNIDVPDGKLKDIVVELPAGLAGSATGAPVCPNEVFGAGFNPCPAETLVGIATLNLSLFGPPTLQDFAVYNLEPGPNQAARFGWKVLIPPVNVISSVRSESDYGLTSTIADTNQAAGVYGSSLTLFGVPADHNASNTPGTPEFGTPGHGPRKWLLRLPTSCDGNDLQVKLKVNSFEDPANVKEYTTDMPAITGCNSVPFDPSITVEPKSRRADSPSGYDVHIKLPQSDDPAQLGTADLKDATVTLPEGVSISPSAANGLQACTDAQFGAGTTNPMNCPDASKVGSVTVDTPSLAQPLEGGLYLGESQPGNRFRLFLHAERSGVVLRLKGSVVPNANTGQLVTQFAGNPQLPFSDLHLSFFGGSRAVLANPPTCGTKTATAELTSHAGQTRSASYSFSINQAADGGPCAGSLPFTPFLVAGSTNPVAGDFSPFVLRLARNDGQQTLSTLSVDLPPGFTAQVAGVPLCAEANAQAGTCAADSRVGSVSVGAGPGSAPVDVTGSAYLAGPYKGAPFSLVFVVPARVGPIDLGTVVLRAAIQVDQRDAHLTVVSDPLPQIVGGVPLRMRSLTVTVDRDEFTINPTSCAVKSIHATVGSGQGGSAATQNRYQVGDCASLGFSPRMSVALTGRKQVSPGDHPGLRVRLRQGAGQAHLRTVRLTLPTGVALDVDNLPSQVCSAAEIAARNCPAAARVGSARAVTPLLSSPLTGGVYLGQGSADLPSLIVLLNGDIDVTLEGTNVFTKAGLRTAFNGIPDVPLSDFQLNLAGGGDGILTPVRRSLCAAKLVAPVRMVGQNGLRKDVRVAIARPCSKSSRKSAKRH
jgi:hypothetical protein